MFHVGTISLMFKISPVRMYVHACVRNLSGNTWPHSSQLTEPLWTDPGLKNEISVDELISS